MTAFALTRTEQDLLLAAATAAPSIHNTQPWRFHFDDGHVDVIGDAERQLVHVDPAGRNLVISCGAALLNLRVAAEHLGYDATADLLPDGPSAPRLARVRLSPSRQQHGMSGALFDAIPMRHTNRWPFEDRAVPTSVLDSLVEAARSEGAYLHPVSDRHERNRLIDLLHVGELERDLDPELAGEAAYWTGVAADRPDGVPGYALGPLPDDPHAATRDLRRGAPVPDRERSHFESAPVLAVLETSRDDHEAWLRAGMALQRVLLVATLEGLATSFINQAIERPSLRWLVRDPADPPGHPQMVIRLGFGAPGPPTPRRTLADVRAADGLTQ
jgi:Nitroreductase family